jgi:MFS family permease
VRGYHGRDRAPIIRLTTLPDKPEQAARAASASPARNSALAHPGFRIFFVLSAAVMMADFNEHVISYWVIYQKFHATWLGGFAVISHWLPFLLLSIPSGALGDRFDTRRIIQIGMALFMCVSIAWGVLFYTNSLQIWHAGLLLVLHGLAGVMWNPSVQLLLHDMVGPAQLPSAIRLAATARNLGMLAGPAIGAGLLALGPANGIFINAFIYLPMILWLWKAPYGPRFRKGAPTPVRALRGFADIVDTLRTVRSTPILLSMTLLAAGASFFIGNAYQAQMPELAHDLGHFRADATYSLLLGADALGALAAAVVLEMRGLLRLTPRTAFALALIWCCALGGFAMAKSYPLALALLLVAGFVELSFNSMAQTLVQLHAPPRIRGRVIGVFMMASLGMRMFSGITVGVIGALIGLHSSIALSAAVLFFVITGLLLTTSRSAAPAQ